MKLRSVFWAWIHSERGSNLSGVLIWAGLQSEGGFNLSGAPIWVGLHSNQGSNLSVTLIWAGLHPERGYILGGAPFWAWFHSEHGSILSGAYLLHESVFYISVHYIWFINPSIITFHSSFRYCQLLWSRILLVDLQQMVLQLWNIVRLLMNYNNVLPYLITQVLLHLLTTVDTSRCLSLLFSRKGILL